MNNSNKNNKSKHLRIGLIGCGRAAEIIYQRALKNFPNIKVTAVLDPVQERRELLSKSFNGSFKYDSFESNLSDGKFFFDCIDAAIIASPPDTHINTAIELLKKNKYILVEKPLAPSTDGLDELIKAESASVASLIMAFNFRYWEPVVHLKKKLLSNSIINFAEIIFTSNYSKWNPVSFKSDPLDDLGPHVFDLINFLFNKEILSISANSSEKSTVNLRIKMSDGMIINGYLAHSDKSRRTIRVISDAGKFFIKVNSVRILPYKNVIRKFLDLTDKVKRKLLNKPSPIKNTYIEQLKRFFDLVNQKSAAAPGIKDGINAVVAVEAARKSIKSMGKEIFINEIK